MGDRVGLPLMIFVHGCGIRVTDEARGEVLQRHQDIVVAIADRNARRASTLMVVHFAELIGSVL